MTFIKLIYLIFYISCEINVSSLASFQIMDILSILSWNFIAINYNRIIEDFIKESKLFNRNHSKEFTKFLIIMLVRKLELHNIPKEPQEHFHCYSKNIYNLSNPKRRCKPISIRRACYPILQCRLKHQYLTHLIFLRKHVEWPMK